MALKEFSADRNDLSGTICTEFGLLGNLSKFCDLCVADKKSCLIFFPKPKWTFRAIASVDRSQPNSPG